MRAKKSYGQHFLAQPDTARRIAHAVDTAGVEQLLEVGPGQGMLTRFLLERELPLLAVEADRDVAAVLREKFPDWSATGLTEADFLKVDLPALLQNRPTALVGNFPYNISSQILIRLLDHRALFPRLVGMFQRELAERVLSPPGSKIYGGISVQVQAFYTGKKVLSLKPGAFNPPPKVDSTVIALERLPGDGPDCDPELFRTIVRTAFGQRRKMLRNSLKGLWPTDIDPEDPRFQRRPEQLGVADFTALTQEVSAAGAA